MMCPIRQLVGLCARGMCLHEIQTFQLAIERFDVGGRGVLQGWWVL